MKFVQAQFSLKYEPRLKIRRDANKIEDILEEYYGPPQVFPIPDEMVPESPRIILNSKDSRGQISFSQLSVDFVTNFEGEYIQTYEDTKEYIVERVQLIKQLLKKIEIDGYYFFGLTYNMHLNINNEKPTEFIRKFLGGKMSEQQNLYEAMQRSAFVEDDKFFVNQQISTFREYQSNGINNMNLLDFTNSRLISEGVNVSLDVNNRYSFLISGNNTSMDKFDEDFSEIFKLIEQYKEKLVD